MIDVWIEAVLVPRRFWFGCRTDFYVCTDFMRWGPFSREQAVDEADTLRLSLGMADGMWVHELPMEGQLPRR